MSQRVEPPRRAGGLLEPELQLAKTCRYNRQQLKEIESLIEEHYDELIGAWQHYFGG